MTKKNLNEKQAAEIKTITGDVKGTAEVELPALKIKRATLSIVGISPLLTHAWDEKSKEQMRAKQQKQAKMAKAAKDPVACFNGAKYLDLEGRDCVPVLAFKNAIVSASRFIGKELPMTVLRGALFVRGQTRNAKGEDLIVLEFERCEMREDMVRVGMGTADMRYRPEYHGWKVKLPIEYNENVVSLAQIVNLVRLAGFSVGICEWRPEKDGQHGRFDVELGA